MTDAEREALHGHLLREFREFMQQHADTPRARIERVREDLEREPLWGQLMERVWPELANPDD